MLCLTTRYSNIHEHNITQLHECHSHHSHHCSSRPNWYHNGTGPKPQAVCCFRMYGCRCAVHQRRSPHMVLHVLMYAWPGEAQQVLDTRTSCTEHRTLQDAGHETDVYFVTVVVHAFGASRLKNKIK